MPTMATACGRASKLSMLSRARQSNREEYQCCGVTSLCRDHLSVQNGTYGHFLRSVPSLSPRFGYAECGIRDTPSLVGVTFPYNNVDVYQAKNNNTPPDAWVEMGFAHPSGSARFSCHRLQRSQSRSSGMDAFRAAAGVGKTHILLIRM
jgi:hypothetical protein